MATVYEARHTVLPRRAALKVMHGDLRRQPGMATRVVQEAAILDSVHHPGVVRVYDCNVLPDRRPWIAMEYVDGETLASRLEAAMKLPAAEVAALIGDVADVLAAVHRVGVIHRDLKPDNLLCTPTSSDFPVRVLDWGVARSGQVSRLTMDGLTPGTPIYMSPEQATGHEVAAPCDIYALGVIAYEALTGRPPFDGCTLAEVVCMHMTRVPAPLRGHCEAPVELCNLVGRMLHKSPAARPRAAEVRQVARAIAAELSQAYEEFEISGVETDRPAARARRASSYMGLSGEVTVVNMAALERGLAEVHAATRQLCWTPEIGRVPNVLAEHQRLVTIAPRAQRDQVAGEIIAADKPR